MKLTPNETPSSLHFALRLTEISRWGIVATSRQQSVGEHAYRVCMIALAMYDYMENNQSHNSYDRIHIAALAMTHDIFEVLSGDLDSVFKIAMRAQYPEALDAVVQNMAKMRRDCDGLYDSAATIERAAKGSIVEIIVKLADLLEAIIYVDTYGANRRHADEIVQNITGRMFEYIEARKKTPINSAALDWARIETFVRQVHPCLE